MAYKYIVNSNPYVEELNIIPDMFKRDKDIIAERDKLKSKLAEQKARYETRLTEQKARYESQLFQKEQQNENLINKLYFFIEENKILKEDNERLSKENGDLLTKYDNLYKKHTPPPEFNPNATPAPPGSW